MENNKYVKFDCDFFKDERIILMETLPAHDTMLVVWFKMIALAEKRGCNGKLILHDGMAFNDKMLSKVFKTEYTIIQMALKTFEEFGMISINDGVITINEWNNYAYDSYKEKIREQNRIRQANRRARLKMLETND